MNDRKESPNASTPVTLLAALLCKGLRRGEGGERSEPGEGISEDRESERPSPQPSPTQVGPARPAHYLCRTRASPSSVGRGSAGAVPFLFATRLFPFPPARRQA